MAVRSIRSRPHSTGQSEWHFEAVEEHFSFVPNSACQQFHHVDKGHGRIETRSHFSVDANSIIDLKEWPGLKSVIKVVSTREIKTEKTTRNRYYLSSIPSKSVQINALAIRSHWGVENNCH
jgi:hypothetical protein